MTPSEAFSEITKSIKTSAVRRLADTLEPHLVDEYLASEWGRMLQFRFRVRSSNGGVVEKFTLWTMPTEVKPVDVTEIFCDAEDELIDFYSHFDCFGAYLMGHGAFFPGAQIEDATEGFFSCGVFMEYAYGGGKLIYTDPGGGMMCRTPNRRCTWLVQGDEAPKLAANSFGELIEKFAQSFDKSEGKEYTGLHPYISISE